MGAVRKALIGAACFASASLGCRRASESSTPEVGGKAGSAVVDDMRDVAKATGKAAKDIGHATVDLAEKAGHDLEDFKDKGGAQDAWITTKVKSALTSEGLDPLHVHVDTDGRVVTLSGSVGSAEKKEKAVSAAKGVTGVLHVKDHLFVKPDER
jgi:hypothetical protein